MGLFINTNEHPTVYKNKVRPAAPNQGFYRQNYVSEIADEQKKINETVQRAFEQLTHLYQQQELAHASSWHKASKQLDTLAMQYKQQEKSQKSTEEWLERLETNSQAINKRLAEEEAVNQDLADHLNLISKSNKEIYDVIEKNKDYYEQMSSQLEKLYLLHHRMEEKIVKQDESQQDVVNRIENQEALTEKLIRQVDYIRSIIFERASFLAEKMEDSYQVTASYVYKLFHGSDQSLTLYYDEPKKVENKGSK